MTAYTVTPNGEHLSDPCECCGSLTRKVNGFVSIGQRTVAVYFASWTEGHVARNGAHWEIIIGPWGDGTSAADRSVVKIHYRNDEGVPGSIMVVDADDAVSYPRLAKRRLKRNDVIGTPLAPEIFAIYDAIVLNDIRLDDLSYSDHPSPPDVSTVTPDRS